MPAAAPRWIFGPFALDLANACLWRGAEAVALPLIVEREVVLHHLHTRLAQAQQETRQVVLVRGEPGIGKTAVVETFAVQAVTQVPLWVAHGQCVEPYSPGEAYLPVLEALVH